MGLTRGGWLATGPTLNFLAATTRLQDATGAFEGGQYRDPLMYGLLSGEQTAGDSAEGVGRQGRKKRVDLGSEWGQSSALAERLHAGVPRRWVCCWMVRNDLVDVWFHCAYVQFGWPVRHPGENAGV